MVNFLLRYRSCHAYGHAAAAGAIWHAFAAACQKRARCIELCRARSHSTQDLQQEPTV